APAPPFFFNHPPSPDIYPLSLHDALPICRARALRVRERRPCARARGARSGRARRGRAAARLRRLLPRLAPARPRAVRAGTARARSEEHTSELQSLTNLLCRLLLEKKKTKH